MPAQITIQRGRVLRPLLVLLAIGVGLLFVAMAWHRWQGVSRSMTQRVARPGVAVDVAPAARRLSQAVQLETWWSAQTPHDAAFEALHRLLQDSFPLAHATLQRQSFGRHALLYTWRGSDPGARPLALLAHQDVVPIAPGTLGDWQQPPFSGAIRDGFVWGRGAWDDKGNLMAMMEAVELLLRSGFKPRQTIYLAFGADEELGGNDGARRMAQWMQQSGIRLGMVLDEGLLITHGMVPGAGKPVALIGTAEKGYVTLHLTARGQPGHTSMPPARSAIGMLGEAVALIEAHPMPARLTGVSRDMLEAVAPDVPGLQGWVMSNLWLTAPLVMHELARSPSANAMLRTTGVATVFQSGERDNVLPGVATASINFRILPGDTSQDVLAHVHRLVDGLGVKVESAAEVTEPSAVTPRDSAGYALVQRTLSELHPDVVVAPGLVIGGTDSRHYAAVADAILRFTPVHARSEDLARFHGSNERISVGNYVEMIQFYERLLRNANDGPMMSTH
jgi:carboxypeptidase PM20D1